MSDKINKALHTLFSFRGSVSTDNNPKDNYLDTNQPAGNQASNTNILSRKPSKVNAILQLNRKLHIAITHGDYFNIKQLIGEGASLKNYLDYRYSDETHPIRLAINFGDAQLLQFFLEEGFNPNHKMFGYYIICPVSYLLNKLNQVYENDGKTKNMVNILIQHGADINIDAGTEGSPLSQAIKWDHHAVFKLLLKHGAKVNAFNPNKDMSEETYIALNKSNKLFIIELICQGAIIKCGCYQNLLPEFDSYDSQDKMAIYELLHKYGIDTSDNIDYFNLPYKDKEELKAILFPR